MTQEELEIAQAACCVGTIWDQYEGTEKFNEMVGKRVQHLIELVRNSLLQEQPEPSNNLVDVDAVREDFMTEVYRVLDADSTNDRANAIIDAFDSLPTVSQNQPEVDLEKEIDACWQNWLSPSNQKEVEGILPKTEFDMYARHFWFKGYNARK